MLRINHSSSGTNAVQQRPDVVRAVLRSGPSSPSLTVFKDCNTAAAPRRGDALSDDHVGALTKHILQIHGVDVTHYKPHTTRGPGKLIHMQMNLPPDISCEFGSWANYQAYCKHYNRLGDVDTPAAALNAHLAVHTTPSPSCAAEAPLHTHPSEQARGRRKGNGAAQDGVGPTPPPKARPRPTKAPMLRGWRSKMSKGPRGVPSGVTCM